MRFTQTSYFKKNDRAQKNVTFLPYVVSRSSMHLSIKVHGKYRRVSACSLVGQ